MLIIEIYFRGGGVFNFKKQWSCFIFIFPLSMLIKYFRWIENANTKNKYLLLLHLMLRTHCLVPSWTQTCSFSWLLTLEQRTNMNPALPSIFILLLGQAAGQNETFQKEAEPPLNCSINDRARFIFYFSYLLSFASFH